MLGAERKLRREEQEVGRMTRFDSMRSLEQNTSEAETARTAGHTKTGRWTLDCGVTGQERENDEFAQLANLSAMLACSSSLSSESPLVSRLSGLCLADGGPQRKTSPIGIELCRLSRVPSPSFFCFLLLCPPSFSAFSFRRSSSELTDFDIHRTKQIHLRASSFKRQNKINSNRLGYCIG